MTTQNGNDTADKSNSDTKITRRKAVKTIAGGITALAAYHTLPAKWEKPILESIFLPAHAQTSGNGIAPVDPSIPVTPGHPDHPDYPLAPNHPDHPHNNPMAVIGSFTTVGIIPPSRVAIDAEITVNRIAEYTFTLVNLQNSSSDTRGYIAQTIPITVSPGFVIEGNVGDTVELTVTNNLTSEVDVAQYVVQGTVSVSCSGTPACGSTVTSGQSVSVTATVTPNPGAGRQVAIGEFCGAVSTGSTSLVTNANGEVTVFGAVPSNICPIDPSFALSFSYSGATCKCEWFIT